MATEAKTKAEWLKYLRETYSDGSPPMVNYSRGWRDTRIRIWPPAILHEKPPKSLHGKYP